MFSRVVAHARFSIFVPDQSCKRINDQRLTKRMLFLFHSAVQRSREYAFPVSLLEKTSKEQNIVLV